MMGGVVLVSSSIETRTAVCNVSNSTQQNPRFLNAQGIFIFIFLMFENYTAFEIKHVSDLRALSKKLFFREKFQ